MGQPRHNKAVFANLVYSEDGEPVESTFIGTEPYYIVMDGDFKRHVSAEYIDGQVIEWLQQQVSAHKGLVAENIMSLLGQDDLFTKAMIDSSIEHMDKTMAQGLPDDARMMLGMMGFKITVDIHGEVINLDMPAQELPGAADD